MTCTWLCARDRGRSTPCPICKRGSDRQAWFQGMFLSLERHAAWVCWYRTNRVSRGGAVLGRCLGDGVVRTFASPALVCRPCTPHTASTESATLLLLPCPNLVP